MSDWLLWCQGMLLVSTRLAVGLALTPIFGGFSIPALARLVIILALSILVVGSQPVLPPLLEGSALARALGREFLLGLGLAVGVQAAFASLSVAGRLLDMQMGFSVGAILDPVSRGHSAVMAASLNMVGIVVFFASNAHALLLTAVCRSFDRLPVWDSVLDRGFDHLLWAGGLMFSTGLALAAPVVAALLLTDVVIAVVSRNLPQMNLLFLSIPLKILLGLVVLVASLAVMGDVMERVLSSPPEALMQLLG